MNALHQFEDVAGIANGIGITNPHLLNRIRATAANLDHYEIAAHLNNAIGNAADAAHARSYEEEYLLEASAETITDYEYYHELAAAWSVVATEHQLTSLETILANDGSVH
ncbi:hypothetical protein SKA58_19625 [Sphingomonas sp. SKA58]|jgi:hypothetical protein|uniref:hypothetical protein n=1 Tax=Sphingomonas sp. (strain SKA58) TaxID=314266 RepID=UPI0000D7BC6D|nr:hypothetical protein [Sphingomonas sp. SKA58]EAT07474.1 hypothetical protein SKA58_19625 [Sphingomonas sp. SKA58]